MCHCQRTYHKGRTGEHFYYLNSQLSQTAIIGCEIKLRIQSEELALVNCSKSFSLTVIYQRTQRPRFILQLSSIHCETLWQLSCFCCYLSQDLRLTAPMSPVSPALKKISSYNNTTDPILSVDAKVSPKPLLPPPHGQRSVGGQKKRHKFKLKDWLQKRVGDIKAEKNK